MPVLKIFVLMLKRAWLFALFVSFCGLTVSAQEGEHFRNDPAAKKYALILVGAAINEEYTEQFGTWGLALRSVLINEYAYTPENVKLLVGNESASSFNIDGPCDAKSIKSTFSRLSKRVNPGDQLLLVMVGHGTGGGETSKFNIVGPDIDAAEFSTLVDSVKTQNIVVINTTSAGHDFAKTQSSFGRILVSATRSRAEKYDTIFPKYIVEGLRNHNADRDKNERVSVLELFNYAKAQVGEYYKERGTLPAEHATLDDNGDGVLVVDPVPGGDGSLAEIAYIDVSLASGAGLSSAATNLKAQMNNLERDIFLLRGNKASYAENEYWTKMEKLLINLAKTTREFNEISSPQ